VVLAQVPALAADGVVLALHVSGGEPFLYQADLRRIAAAGKDAGIAVGVNTNAFWATSRQKAQVILEAMPGLTQLFISASEYHQAYVPVDRPLAAAAAGIEIGLHVNLTGYTPGGSPTPFWADVCERLRPLRERVRLGLRPVEAAGRGGQLVEAAWRPVRDGWPEGGCPLLNRPVVLEDGRVAACCNTTAVNACGASPLVLGNIHDRPLAEVLSYGRHDPILQVIRLFGPGFLASILPGERQRRLRGRYPDGDICSLCTEIMSDPELLEDLRGILRTPKWTRFLAAADALTAAH
jgi:hypothetical protein